MAMFWKILLSMFLVASFSRATVVPDQNSEAGEILGPSVGADVEEVPGCLIGDHLLTSGQSVPIEGCAELKCITLDDGNLGVAEIYCPESQEEPPAGCRRLPRPATPYPDCCVDVLECVELKQVIVPVVFGSNNITKIDAEGRQKLLQLAGLLKGGEEDLEMSNTVEGERIEGFNEKSFKGEETKKFIRHHLHKKESKPDSEN